VESHHVGQENFAAAAVGFALYISTEIGAVAIAMQHAAEDGQVWLDGQAAQRLLFKAQHLAGGFVGELDFTAAVQRENGERTGFDEDEQLAFRLEPEQNVLIALGEVFGQHPAAMVQLGDEEAGHGEAGYGHHQTPRGAGAQTNGLKPRINSHPVFPDVPCAGSRASVK